MTGAAPSGSPAPARLSLEGLTLESGASTYEADGFALRHAAAPERIVEIAERFQGAGAFLEMIAGEDRRPDLEKMRLAYTFNWFDRTERHLVIVDLPGQIPGAKAPSIAGVFPGADWLEREIFDMYGVTFTNHPNLKRILLPDDADFHALLKDFGRIEDAPQNAGAPGGEK